LLFGDEALSLLVDGFQSGRSTTAAASEKTLDAFGSSPISINFDEHVTPFDLDWKTPHAFLGRRSSHCTTLDVEVRAVPRTLDSISL
jgi:hypothetical protein